MEHLIDDPKERSMLQSEGAKKARLRRHEYSTNRGRPLKNQSKYYTAHVLVTEETLAYLHKNKLPGEPLGSVVERLLLRKKVEGPLNRSGEYAESTEAYIDRMVRTHNSLEETVEAMKKDGVTFT